MPRTLVIAYRTKSILTSSCACDSDNVEAPITSHAMCHQRPSDIEKRLVGTLCGSFNCHVMAFSVRFTRQVTFFGRAILQLGNKNHVWL